VETERSPKPAMPATDKERAERIARGDRGAFESLMREHNRRLYRVARAILDDDAEAEEALQDAYLAAYRHIGAFHAEAKLSTWLTRIVVNEALQRRRRNKRQEVVLLVVK